MSPLVQHKQKKDKESTVISDALISQQAEAQTMDITDAV